MWLVDTGCVYDRVSRREPALIKRFVNKAKVPITFRTANGPTRTANVANIYVKELDDNITPYVVENTHQFLLLATDALNSITHLMGLPINLFTSSALME